MCSLQHAQSHLECIGDGRHKARQVARECTKTTKAERRLDARRIAHLQHPVKAWCQRRVPKRREEAKQDALHLQVIKGHVLVLWHEAPIVFQQLLQRRPPGICSRAQCIQCGCGRSRSGRIVVRVRTADMNQPRTELEYAARIARQKGPKTLSTVVPASMYENM